MNRLLKVKIEEFEKQSRENSVKASNKIISLKKEIAKLEVNRARLLSLFQAATNKLHAKQHVKVTKQPKYNAEKINAFRESHLATAFFTSLKKAVIRLRRMKIFNRAQDNKYRRRLLKFLKRNLQVNKLLKHLIIKKNKKLKHKSLKGLRHNINYQNTIRYSQIMHNLILMKKVFKGFHKQPIMKQTERINYSIAMKQYIRYTKYKVLSAFKSYLLNLNLLYKDHLELAFNHNKEIVNKKLFKGLKEYRSKGKVDKLVLNKALDQYNKRIGRKVLVGLKWTTISNLIKENKVQKYRNRRYRKTMKAFFTQFKRYLLGKYKGKKLKQIQSKIRRNRIFNYWKNIFYREIYKNIRYEAAYGQYLKKLAHKALKALNKSMVYEIQLSKAIHVTSYKHIKYTTKRYINHWLINTRIRVLLRKILIRHNKKVKNNKLKVWIKQCKDISLSNLNEYLVVLKVKRKNKQRLRKLLNEWLKLSRTKRIARTIGNKLCRINNLTMKQQVFCIWIKRFISALNSNKQNLIHFVGNKDIEGNIKEIKNDCKVLENELKERSIHKASILKELANRENDIVKKSLELDNKRQHCKDIQTAINTCKEKLEAKENKCIGLDTERISLLNVLEKEKRILDIKEEHLNNYIKELKAKNLVTEELENKARQLKDLNKRVMEVLKENTNLFDNPSTLYKPYEPLIIPVIDEKHLNERASDIKREIEQRLRRVEAELKTISRFTNNP